MYILLAMPDAGEYKTDLEARPAFPVFHFLRSPPKRT